MNVSTMHNGRRNRLLVGVAAIALVLSTAGAGSMVLGQDSGIAPGCEGWGTPIPEDLCTPVIEDGSPTVEPTGTNHPPTPVYPTATASPTPDDPVIVGGEVIEEIPDTGTGSTAGR